jgi:hypothetical protein
LRGPWVEGKSYTIAIGTVPLPSLQNDPRIAFLEAWQTRYIIAICQIGVKKKKRKKTAATDEPFDYAHGQARMHADEGTCQR